MNILFITLVFSESRGIYTDLMQEMKNKGNEVFVVTPIEKRYNQETNFEKLNGINILRVKTGNVQKVNLIEKGISTLLLEKQFIKAIDRYLKDIKFDLVVYSTPPITFSNVVRHIKKRDGANTYLMLKDIFPQNAVDIDMMKKDGLLYRFFRKKEVSLYNQSDYIGCMSQGNIEFLLEHNDFIDKNKVEILPNTITPLEPRNLTQKEIVELRKKYSIPLDKTVFIYGGNLGKPQGVDFIADCISKNETRSDSFILIIGSGTEYTTLESFIKENKIKNSIIYSNMPKEDYDNVIKACDVGLVFLDRRFTIPNIPSRILSYMECSMPIVASTDKNTDLGDILKYGEFGLWSESGNIEDFYRNIDMICKNKELASLMGKNGRQYLERNYTSKIGYEIIMNHFASNPDDIDEMAL